jgi:hypothetical protein
LLNGDQVLISNYGITLSGGTVVDGSTITVVVDMAKRINLPRRITTTEGMQVWASTSTQFDTRIEFVTGSLSFNQCRLVIPTLGNSYIEFYDQWTPLVDGEDAVEIVYPRNVATPESHERSGTYDGSTTILVEA